MNSSSDLLAALSAYHATLLWMALLCLAVLVQSFLAGAIGLGKSEEVPGMPLKGSHQDFSFRTLRTYANSVENLPVFAITVVLAILAGVTASWVNGLVAVHVILRLAYWVIYYRGVGKVGGGPRTMAYAAAWFVNLVLALLTLWFLL